MDLHNVQVLEAPVTNGWNRLSWQASQACDDCWLAPPANISSVLPTGIPALIRTATSASIAGQWLQRTVSSVTRFLSAARQNQSVLTSKTRCVLTEVVILLSWKLLDLNLCLADNSIRLLCYLQLWFWRISVYSEGMNMLDYAGPDQPVHLLAALNHESKWGRSTCLYA